MRVEEAPLTSTSGVEAVAATAAVMVVVETVVGAAETVGVVWYVSHGYTCSTPYHNSLRKTCFT